MKYGKMMKGIGVAALALTVVSSCIVGGTLAKYTTTATGQGSAIVAKWAPKFSDESGTEYSNETKVELTDTTVSKANKVTSKRVAPGTQGSFEVQVSKEDTEVAFKYSVKISNLSTGWPENLKFYSDDTYSTPITPVQENGEDVYPVIPEATMLLDASTTTVSKTVYWKWPFETGVGESAVAESDKKESELGKKDESARSMSFDISCVATQVE